MRLPRNCEQKKAAIGLRYRTQLFTKSARGAGAESESRRRGGRKSSERRRRPIAIDFLAAPARAREQSAYRGIAPPLSPAEIRGAMRGGDFVAPHCRFSGRAPPRDRRSADLFIARECRMQIRRAARDSGQQFITAAAQWPSADKDFNGAGGGGFFAAGPRDHAKSARAFSLGRPCRVSFRGAFDDVAL